MGNKTMATDISIIWWVETFLDPIIFGRIEKDNDTLLDDCVLLKEYLFNNPVVGETVKFLRQENQFSDMPTLQMMGNLFYLAQQKTFTQMQDCFLIFVSLWGLPKPVSFVETNVKIHDVTDMKPDEYLVLTEQGKSTKVYNAFVTGYFIKKRFKLLSDNAVLLLIKHPTSDNFLKAIQDGLVSNEDEHDRLAIQDLKYFFGIVDVYPQIDL